MTITDYNDRTVTVGCDVTVNGRPGVVTSLGEWDGDVDMEGRPLAVEPRVTVRFADGSTERFATADWDHPYYGPGMDHNDGTGSVEDVEVVTHDTEKEHA